MNFNDFYRTFRSKKPRRNNNKQQNLTTMRNDRDENNWMTWICENVRVDKIQKDNTLHESKL